MEDVWWYEEFKILIALLGEAVDSWKLSLIIVAVMGKGTILFQTGEFIPCSAYLNFHGCEQNHNQIKFNGV